MSLSRITFPFGVTDGRLNLSRGPQAAQETINALIRIHTGEMPLSRDYGANLEYNIPPELAFQHVERISQSLAQYHPHLTLTSAVPVLSDEGVVLDWAIGVDVEGDV